ncbi:MAG: sulfatase-like hydrolase/transferase [Bdellovibrionota bacterium]
MLILAFDQLDNERLNCSEEKNDDNSGFALICKEFMRFTHAYTTSLQPAAAIGSVLTGQYPLVHGVHRSFDLLNPQVRTTQEAAYNQGYRTGFFAGNPHVLKKTGLSKYFDTFDDSAAAQYSNQIIKDFKITSENFLDWQKEDSTPFFAVITNSEIDALNELDTTTTNLEKLDEKLFNFINELKDRGIWDKTYVYVVGLRGSNNYNRLNETAFLNLHSENTLVSLLIKPPRMQGDEGISWKNDIPINLADVGYTLKSFFGSDEPSTLDGFSLLNLNQFYSEASDSIASTRQLLVEASNAWIKSPLQLNFAIISPTLLIIDRKDETEIFNLATDRFEVVNLNNKKNTEQDIPSIRRLFMTSITPIDDNGTTMARDYLKNTLPAADFFSLKVSENHPLYLYWLNQQLKTKQIDKLDLTKLDMAYSGCLNLISKPPTSLSQLKSCHDSLFIDYLKFKHASLFGLNPEKAKLTYELSRKKYFEEIKISIWNLALENMWGLYQPNKAWYHPLIFVDPIFVL